VRGADKERKGTDLTGAGALFEDADTVAAPGESKCACETSDAAADDDEIDGEGGGTLCDGHGCGDGNSYGVV